MGRNILFVQVSNSACDPYERRPVVSDGVGGCSFLENLLRNVKRAERVDAVYVVTSDSSGDDDIAVIAENQGCGCLRISGDSQFAFSDKNRRFAKNYLYRDSFQGMLSVECLLHYTADSSNDELIEADVALVLEAWMMPFADGEGIDRLIEQFGETGEFLPIGRTGSGVAVAPIKTVLDIYRAYKATRKKEIKSFQKRIEGQRARVKSVGGGIGGKLIELKEKFINRETERLTTLMGLFNYRRGREGDTSALPTGPFLPMMFSVVRDIERKLLNDIDEVTSAPDGNAFPDIAELDRWRCDYDERLGRLLPGYLEVEPTSRCNLSCDFCLRGKMQRPDGDMELELFKQIIDEVKDQIPFVNLSGFGEPLMAGSIVEMVEYAKNAGVLRVAIESNGTLLTEEMFRRLMDAGLDMLIINVNAYDRSFGELGLSDLDGLLMRLIEQRNGTGKETPLIIPQVIKEQGFDEQTETIYSRWEFVADTIVIQPFNDFCGRVEDRTVVNFAPLERKECYKILHSPTVMFDGRMPVCKQRVDVDEEQPDVKDSSLLELWNRDELKMKRNLLRGGSLDEVCEKCNQHYLRDMGFDRSDEAQAFVGRRINEFIKGPYSTAALARVEDLLADEKIDEALECIKETLTYDPMNEKIKGKLMELANV
jgi:Radical SAM superfamily